MDSAKTNTVGKSEKNMGRKSKHLLENIQQSFIYKALNSLYSKF